jgi:ABC-type transport system involved in multi-copper enzyme maturation permease subunit
MSLTQLAGIVRYELLMSWRRGSLRTIVVMTVLMAALSRVIPPLNHDMLAERLRLWSESAVMIRTAATIADSTFLVVMALFLLPLVVAEVFPLDRQYQMRELLDTLPISAGTYVIGKLASIWLVVIVSFVVVGVTSGLVAWGELGDFDLPTYLLFWLFGMLALALFSSECAMLLASGSENRRQAVLWGMAAAVLALIAYFVLPLADYLWIGLLLPTAISVTTPGEALFFLQFPDPTSAGFLARIGLVLVVMAGMLWWAIRQSGKARNEV